MAYLGPAPSSGPKPASEVEYAPTGDIAATNVQSAITEIDSEKASKAIATAAGMLGVFFMSTAPFGWLKSNGAAVSLITYPDLIAIYCGNGNNATADWGYRCTNPASPSASRSTTGDYIVLPDCRGEFIRGWDDARGIDTSRNLWLAQLDAFQGHRHSATGSTASGNSLWFGNASNLTPGSGGNGPAYFGDTTLNLAIGNSTTDGVNGTPRTAAETRPRNISALVCIKY